MSSDKALQQQKSGHKLANDTKKWWNKNNWDILFGMKTKQKKIKEKNQIKSEMAKNKNWVI